MTKIMLVEDDKSLREIYGVRLLAEGYEIISAGNGEEALAMAVKEHPDLVLSDVMMPKISGFDMLDILRATPETKDIKVIVMTALSSEDQRERGEKLGANRYLVKSQVGIEDVVRSVHDVLADVPNAPSSAAEKFGLPTESAAIKPNGASAQPDTAQDTQPATPAPKPTINATPETTKPITTESTNPTIAQTINVTDASTQGETASTQEATPVMDPTNNQANDNTNTAPTTPIVPEPYTPPVAPPTPTEPINDIPAPTTIPMPTPTPNPQPSTPAVNTPPVVADESQPTPAPIAPVVPKPDLPEPTAPFSSPAPASLGDRVINPISKPEEDTAEDMATMMNKELNDGSNTNPVTTDQPTT